ncbi:unnamed protein product [Schistocephalus solidus]|uniref:Uncharacterized protein n=1 Tax=Schistocephalus solidus TaxID=70667 RepID=A0A183TAN6_SCHSO|nr:unnamed protein product [Schistocephalus solidus]
MEEIRMTQAYYYLSRAKDPAYSVDSDFLKVTPPPYTYVFQRCALSQRLYRNELQQLPQLARADHPDLGYGDDTAVQESCSQPKTVWKNPP